MLTRLARRALPRISDTERQALEAGTVWIEGQIFRGRLDWKAVLAEPYPRLTEREQSFLDGPVSEVCALVDEREVARTGNLPDEAWDLLRRHRFFGLNLPEEWGGQGFTSLACSSIFGKLASRSLALAVTVLIPNSVGPGELLVHYGTQDQKERYLPRLARGEEIPCFALTETTAGSDAASIRSKGTVFRDGEGRTMLRLDFEKRYITLAPIATLIGLAVQLEDPENVLGMGVAPGITCVLVPSSTPGVEIGQRHDPMGVPFPNGPVRGRGVVVPVEQVIGGPSQAGRGWKMLMEALSAGRAISLPAQSVGGAKMIARVAGAYATVREQFGLPIGRFEGIEEPLARIAGLTYLMDATRVFTCGAVDSGQRPAVVSAIVKHLETELMRDLARDGMDIVGGSGICLGPRNLMARAWLGAPIGITVEGANILTRTLIIFGQGLLRGHPHLLDEVRAIENGDSAAFRRAMAAHVRHVIRTQFREICLTFTRGLLSSTAGGRLTSRFVRRVNWAATRFALLSDYALASLEGSLKLCGMITGRFADALSWIYAAIATVRRFEAEGRKKEDEPLFAWAMEHALHHVQLAFTGICGALPGTIGLLLRTAGLVSLRLNPLSPGPSDALSKRVAALLRVPGEQRDRLTEGLDLTAEPVRRLERAFELTIATEGPRRKVRAGQRAGGLPPDELDAADKALTVGLISKKDHARLTEAREARLDAVEVDSVGAVRKDGN
jgi:acyl-CoA dehydrogenase